MVLQPHTLVAKPLSGMDYLIIAVLVIVAAIVIYLLWPLIIAIIIVGAAYYIYRWYRHRL